MYSVYPDYEARKREEVVGLGETVLGFFMGRRRTTVGSVAARKRRLTSKAKREVEETTEEIAELEKDMEQIDAELKEVVAEITQKCESATDRIEITQLKPRRTDINIQFTALAWLPMWQISHTAGERTMTEVIPAYSHTKKVEPN